MNEKLPVHSEVINLRSLLLPNNLSDHTNIDFSLVKRDEFPYMYFLINHASQGILTIRKEIDRDELCRLRRCRCDTWCDLEIQIIFNQTKINIELITIRIIDRNDHKPIFLNNQISLTIVENAPIGAMIKLEAAIDYDQGQNSITGYSLVSSKPLPFSLRYNLIRGDLSLIIEDVLDRESISFYRFDIIARDGDNQTGILHVLVTIDDINDSPPKFEQVIYIVNNISESISIDSIVCRVHATDDDEGVNGEINYYLVSQDNCFHIDPITGDIRVRCLLDYETKTIHRLEIEAKDKGEGYKTDFCTVLIHVLDENDNAPIIDIYPYDMHVETNSITLYVNESIPISSRILSLSILDRDSGDNGRVTWKLDQSSSIPFELIRLTENTGELHTNDLLDYEQKSQYNLILEARDHGRPLSKLTYLYIIIMIIDENDNTPTFQERSMTSTINEHVKFHNKDGYEIFHLQAEDYDDGLNGEIIYSIISRENEFFDIDPSTGIIRALTGFDRNEQDTYILQVEARDKGTPSLASQGTITFKIIGQNTYPPTCDIINNNNNNNITWSIMENSEFGTIVGVISCHDDDKDSPNEQISVYYQWFPEGKQDDRNIYLVPFEIMTAKNNISESKISIMISVNGSVDRELISFYKLFLIISDHGNPSQSINISISIEVLDDNDHCPQLSIDSTFIMINRDVETPYFEMNLIASDLDIGSNANITFELSPVTSPLFTILYPNGTLIIETSSDLITDDSLVLLHVQIRDYGQPTPCLIVETLRVFIGTNTTDWLNVIKKNNYDDRSLNLPNEGFQQGKRMAHAYSISSSSLSSPLFQYPSSISSLSTRKQIFLVFIGSSIIMFIIVLTMVLCFIDCLHKSTKERKHQISMIKSNGVNNHSSTPMIKPMHSLNLLPMKTKHFYEDNSSTNHYKSLLPPTKMKSNIIISSSNSHSSSSVDSTTRANTALNRAMTNTYTYVALNTSDDFMPVDFDENINSNDDDDDDDDDERRIELMMTTV